MRFVRIFDDEPRLKYTRTKHDPRMCTHRRYMLVTRLVAYTALMAFQYVVPRVVRVRISWYTRGYAAVRSRVRLRLAKREIQ